MKPSLPQVLDSTMIVDFRSCYERFRNRYMLHLMGKDKSGDLIAGGAIAAAIEAVRIGVYQHGKDVPNSLIPAYKAFVKEWRDYIPPENSRSFKTFGNCWSAVAQAASSSPFSAWRTLFISSMPRDAISRR